MYLLYFNKIDGKEISNSKSTIGPFLCFRHTYFHVIQQTVLKINIFIMIIYRHATTSTVVGH